MKNWLILLILSLGVESSSSQIGNDGLLAQISSAELGLLDKADSGSQNNLRIENQLLKQQVEMYRAQEQIRRLSAEKGMDNGVKIVFLVFMILIVSAILREVKKKVSIPLSPMLLVIGLVLGILQQYLGFVGECVHLLNSIDPHSLLMIFIPALVFEGSYNTNTYVFGKSK